MQKGHILTGIGSAVGLLLTVLGLVVLSDVKDAHSSHVAPTRFLFDGRADPSQPVVWLEGRLSGEMGKTIQVKQADCEVRMPLCEGKACVVFHMSSEGLVHDQDDFANVKMPVRLWGDADLKLARSRLRQSHLHLGDLRVACDVKYTYNRFQHLTNIEPTMSYEWSLRELSKKLFGTETSILGDAQFGFKRKNMSYQKPTHFKNMQYVSGAMTGNAEMRIPPGKTADAVVDFLRRVEIEVLADVGYAESSFRTVNGTASVAGRCSHNVGAKGDVKVSLPATIRGSFHLHAILNALAKFSQATETTSEDSMNEESHSHGLKIVNEPRSFVGGLFGISHKLESGGNFAKIGQHVRRLHSVLSDRDPGNISRRLAVQEVSKYSVFLKETIYTGNSVLKISTQCKENSKRRPGATCGVLVTVDPDLVQKDEPPGDTQVVAEGELKVNDVSKDWKVSADVTTKGFDYAGEEEDVEDVKANFGLTYSNAEKALRKNDDLEKMLVVRVSKRIGNKSEKDWPERSKWVGDVMTIEGDLTMSFKSGFDANPVGDKFRYELGLAALGLPSMPVQSKFAISGSREKAGKTETIVPKTEVVHSSTESGKTTTHKIEVTMADHTNSVEASRVMTPRDSEVRVKPEDGAWDEKDGDKFKYAWRESADYLSGKSLDFKATMKATITIIATEKDGKTTDFDVTVQMNTQCKLATTDVSSVGAIDNNLYKDLTSLNAIKTSTNPRKWECEDDRSTRCQDQSEVAAGTSYDCCMSTGTDYSDAFNDQSACDAMPLQLMDGIDMKIGDSNAKKFKISVTKDESGNVKTSKGKAGAYQYKIQFSQGEDKPSSVDLTYLEFNRMDLIVKLEGLITITAAVDANWDLSVAEMKQTVDVVTADGDGEESMTISLLQTNTKDLITISEDGVVHMVDGGKNSLTLTVMEKGPDKELVKVVGSMTTTEKTDQSAIDGSVDVFYQGTKEFAATVDVDGNSKQYKFGLAISIPGEGTTLTATSTLVNSGKEYAGDVVCKDVSKDETFTFYTTFTQGFLPDRKDDEFTMSFALGSKGKGLDEIGAELVWKAKRGEAPMRDLKNIGASFNLFSFDEKLPTDPKAPMREKTPQVKVAANMGMPYDADVDPSKSKIAQVTRFLGKFALKDPTKFDRQKYIQGMAKAAGIEPEQVQVAAVKYLCKLKYKFTVAVDKEKARKIVAGAAKVAIDRVTVTIKSARRLGVETRRLAATEVDAEITATSGEDLATVSVAADDPAAVSASLATETGESGASATVDSAENLVEVETELESDAGETAIEIPGEGAINAALGDELGTDVETKEIEELPSTERVASGYISSAYMISPLSCFLLGVASLFGTFQ